MVKPPDFKPDKALVDIEEDALDVAELAKGISASIVRMRANDGLVIGLYGAWGSGKTTFINFVKQALSKHDEKEQPVILDFNPWLFSGHEDLIQRYLVELSKALSPKQHKLMKYRMGFVKGVENFTDVSKELLIFAASLKGVPMVAGGVKALNTLSKGAIEKLSKQKPLSQQKEKIEKLLRGRKRKILVVIDDIDRLEASEVMDIFRMVKSVADFPNVIYLLSFDKKLVANIVKDFQRADGKDYLEKIVQYDIDLPYPNPANVLTLFGERIDPVIQEPGGKNWDKDRWSNLYRDYLRERIKTPRQAIRFSNAFNVAYPALRAEVDPVDFLAIEALRMFHPDVFHEISRNADRFTDLGQDEFDADKTDPPYFEKVLNLVDERDRAAVKDLLEILFPRVENAFSNYKASSSEMHEWKSQARICSSNHIRRYFSYSVPFDQFSDTEIYKALKLTVDPDKFGDLLIPYSKEISKHGKSRIPDFLDRFLPIVSAGQADEYLKDVIKSYLILGDLIVRKDDEDRSHFFGIETDLRVLWIIFAALRRMPVNEVFDTIKDAMKNTKSLHIPIRLLFYFGREHGLYGKNKKESLRDGEEGPYLTLKELKELEKIVLSKIRKSAKDNSLLENENLPAILYRWRDILGSLDEPRAWVQKIASSDDNLKKLFVRFARVSVSSNMKGTTETIYVRADNIADFLDLDSTAERVKKFLANEDLDKKQTDALGAFITSYENKKSGKSDDWD
ncbi:MAG: P-loop NTPase fold protein [Alphaproteobacteria bacterium]|nr:P-loop NTPase fold protein [Alphaproteobacteria bacterium]